jgi:glycosyltransferase involved in cell wall biosynthesis
MRGVKVVSWSGTSGYALAALDYVRGLVAAGVPVQWVPLGREGPHANVPWRAELGIEALDFFPALADDPVHADLPALLERCCRPCAYDTVLVQLPPEYWPVHFEPGMRNAGYTAWETDRVPPHWPPLLNLASRVLVPSRMNRDVFERCGVVVPVRAVPHMLRAVPPPATDAARRRIRATLGIGADTTVFYSINTWEPRKGVFDLLNAFARAFGDADDVLLLLKTHTTGYGAPPSFAVTPVAELLAKWRERAQKGRATGLPAMRAIDRPLSGGEIEDLHVAGDVFVSLTRGEGWGMGACEALARGRPVLITGWGGQLDYLGADWPWLVRYALTAVSPWPGQSSFLSSQRWAQPELDHAAQLLRRLHGDLAAAQMHAARAAAALRDRLSPARVTAALLESLDD